METMFYVIPALIIVVVLCGAVAVIRRARATSRAWSSGLTAEARCLRTYTTTSGGAGDTRVSTTLHHVYEFTTREGRTVRFEERSGSGTVLEGDIVTVYYTADHPERATAEAPARAKLMLGTGLALVFFGAFIAFCIGFIVVTHEAAPAADNFMTP
jgi:hypothetical protein